MPSVRMSREPAARAAERPKPAQPGLSQEEREELRWRIDEAARRKVRIITRPLNEKEYAVLDVLKVAQRSMTVGEIADALLWNRHGRTRDHLVSLERAGRVARTEGRRRGSVLWALTRRR